METNNRAIENFNELIFENKHKEYGAYALRKSYNNNVTKALFITSLFFGLLAMTAASLNKGKEKAPDISGNIPPIDSVVICEYFMDPPEKLKDEIKERVEKKAPQTDNINYKPDDKAVETETKINEEAKIIAGGDEKGTDSIEFNEIPNVFVVKQPVPIDNTPSEWVNEMPEFDGNMYQFIKDNLRYPRAAIENSTSGTVGISFVVEMDGSIGNVKIINAVGDGCSEEAMRVVKLMPKWKPGKSNGEPKRVLYRLPVKFRIK